MRAIQVCPAWMECRELRVGLETQDVMVCLAGLAGRARKVTKERLVFPAGWVLTDDQVFKDAKEQGAFLYEPLLFGRN